MVWSFDHDIQGVPLGFGRDGDRQADQPKRSACYGPGESKRAPNEQVRGFGDGAPFLRLTQWSYFIGDEWSGTFFPLAGPTTAPLFTNDPPTVSNSISREMVLDVSNGATSERLWFGVVVLTPQTATDAMSEWINVRYPKLTGRAQRRLLPPLREASAYFAAGETEAAKVALGLFLKRLKISRLPLTTHEARVFKRLTPIIVNTAAD